MSDKSDRTRSTEFEMSIGIPQENDELGVYFTAW